MRAAGNISDKRRMVPSDIVLRVWTLLSQERMLVCNSARNIGSKKLRVYYYRFTADSAPYLEAMSMSQIKFKLITRGSQ